LAPHCWVDFPPSVNCLIGLWWLGKIFYPTQFPDDLRAIVRDFYQRFYRVPITDDQIKQVLEGRP
jgi:iron complex transport system substrate-binding protein